MHVFNAYRSPDETTNDGATVSVRQARLRVGVIGAGTIVENIHLPVLANLPGVCVAWVADRSDDRARRMARAFDVDARPLCETDDADILLVAIPMLGRDCWYEHATRHGMAMFVEKPFAVSLAQHDYLADIVPKRTAVGYQRRFLATNRFARTAVTERWYGDLIGITHAEGGRATRAGAPGYADLQPSEGGGLIVNLGCHGLDSAMYVSGATAANIDDRHIVWDDGVDRETDARILLDTPRGEVVLTFKLSDIAHQPNTTRYQFETAAIEVSVAPTASIGLLRESAAPIRLLLEDGVFTSRQAGFAQWHSFLGSIARGETPKLAPQNFRLTSQITGELLAR